jgi:hypothetical protein
VSTTVGAAWSNPLDKVFNECGRIYFVMELPGRWGVPALDKDLSEMREKCIADSQDYYGTFITTIECLTPMGDLDVEPIVWGVTQQLALP